MYFHANRAVLTPGNARLTASDSLPCSTEGAERLLKPCKHKGSSELKPGLALESKSRFCGRSQLCKAAPASLPFPLRRGYHSHAAISSIFRMVWSSPGDTQLGIGIFEEQRCKSSRCRLTSPR